MGAVRYLARLQMRRRWTTPVIVALVLGLVGGVATALVAGSRRSASVVDRYFAAMNPYSIQLYAPAITQEQAEGLPGVERADGFTYIPFVQQASGRSRSGPINVNGVANAMLDPTFELVDGRYPRAGEIDAAIVNRPYLDSFGGGVGDTVRLRAYEDGDAEGGNATGRPPTGPTYEFRIVGVVRTPAETILDEPKLAGASVYESPEAFYTQIEFFDAHRSELYDFGKGYMLVLRDSAQRDEVQNAARALNAAAGNTELLSFNEPPFRPRRPSYEVAVDLESSALLALGIVLAIVGATVLALVLRADQRLHNRDHAALRAIGVTRSQFATSATLRTLPPAVVGAVLACLVAVLLSDQFPIGLGSQLELDDGRQVNVAVLGGALVVSVAFMATCAFAFAARDPDRRPRARRGTVTSWLAGVGAREDVVLGTHFAFGRGEAPTTVPTRPAIAGGIVALIAVIAGGIFVDNVNKLYATPEDRGWTWDVIVGNPDSPFSNADTVRALENDPRFSSRTLGAWGPVLINNRPVEVLAYDVTGSAPPIATEGRMPRGPREIVLGTKLLERLNVEIGSEVQLFVEAGGGDEGADGIGKPVAVTVVGTGVAPAFGDAEPGEQAIVSTEALEGFGPAAASMVMARLAGSDHDAVVAELARDYPDQITTDIVSARVVNLHRVRTLPLLGLALAAVLATMLIAYTLALSARARAREFGTLRALGVSSRGLGRVLAWEGVAIALVIVAIGMPLGVVLGGYAWDLVTEQIGLNPHTVYRMWIPFAALATLVLAVVCSRLPARRARRMNVAALLRDE